MKKLNIDLTTETPIPINQSPKYYPAGRPSISTVYRHFTRGCCDAKLETFVEGGRRYTTIEQSCGLSSGPRRILPALLSCHRVPPVASERRRFVRPSVHARRLAYETRKPPATDGRPGMVFTSKTSRLAFLEI